MSIHIYIPNIYTPIYIYIYIIERLKGEINWGENSIFKRATY